MKLKKRNTCSCWHVYCCAPLPGKKGRHCGDRSQGCRIRAGKKVRRKLPGQGQPFQPAFHDVLHHLPVERAVQVHRDRQGARTVNNYGSCGPGIS
jgi:hypothetical protein